MCINDFFVLNISRLFYIFKLHFNLLVHMHTAHHPTLKKKHIRAGESLVLLGGD